MRLSVSEHGKRRQGRMAEKEGRDRLIVDVADALTLDQEVDWGRCAREATADTRRKLEQLRVVADVRSASRARGEAAADEAAAGFGPPGGVLVRRVEQALVAFSALWVALLFVLGLWGWNDFQQEYEGYTPYAGSVVLGYAATACLFLLAGRRDRRTWLLGAFFLLKATIINPFMLLELLRGAPPVEPFGHPDFGFPYVYPFMFAPAFLWAFARECPRVHRGTRLDGLARRMVPVSVLLGGVVWVGSVTWFVLARAGHVSLAVSWVVFDGVFATLNLLSLGAVVVVVLRAHTAAAAERRRVALFGIGFLLWVGLRSAYEVVEVFTPGDLVSNYRWTPTVAAAQLLRFPGMVLLWYSVLAVRVPHVREVVRASLGRLLSRVWLPGVLAAAPAAGLVWRLASRPEQTVAGVVADPVAQVLGASAALLSLAAAGRGRLLVGLDAWLYPDTADQRQALADAASALAKAGRVTAVGRVVRRTARRACGAPVTLLVQSDPAAEGGSLHDPAGGLPPLARGSAVVCVLETAGGFLRVDSQDETSDFGLLPHEDRRWAVAAGADAIVAVPGPGAALLGVLVAGRRFDGRIVRPVDVRFSKRWGRRRGWRSVAWRRCGRGRPGRWTSRRPRSAPRADAWRRPGSGPGATAGRPMSKRRRRGFWRASTGWCGDWAAAAWGRSTWRATSGWSGTSPSRPCGASRSFG